ncbi:Crp/Fnr family transcriptional regulator [Evansella sp. AB-P1]|uniref:Crp/Fnr family transcriptional regulator n=1 Tax=Evansella sp. AB-P1 TaxID=3037653 RepID=UPI00241D7F45|nr:Crp/Fnr family transcriptional regulator [Evansella sp. AB-P1]MDG5789379.1 Crp/Fnr family transcriptional regulator [Evansella sp. AB-P1]
MRHSDSGCSAHHHSCAAAGSVQACVSIVPIFNHLEPVQLEQIMETVQSATYKKGETIYRAGEKSDSLYIVHKGSVKIYRLSASGKEHMVSLLHPGDFTGEYALFSESIHESYGEALEETQMCIIQRDDIHAFLEKYPAISLKILQEFSQKLERSEKQTAYFATEKVETRIALYLVELADKLSSGKTVVLPMSRKDLAAYLGTTPETISRKIADLEAQGLLKQLSKKKLEILDVDGLL